MPKAFIPANAVLPAYAMSEPAPPVAAPNSLAQGLMSLPEIAGAAEDVVKNVMRVEPMIAGMAGMFVPGLSVVQPWIVMLTPFLERALDDISKGNNGDVIGAFVELMQHLNKNGVNSPVLTPSVPSEEINASQVGSG